MEGVQNENVSGNYITQSQNVQESFDITECRDCKYCHGLQAVNDAYDVSQYGCTGTNELLYEGEGLGHGVSNVRSSKLVWSGSHDVDYSIECIASHHLFGCVGLRHDEYCILNKKYSKEEYEKIIPKLIEKVKEEGEWGEFFPNKLCPFGYNESVSYEYQPLSR